MPPAEDATLSALALADTGGTAVALSPAFAPATESYIASVGSAVDEITITPTTSVNGATVAYLDAGDNAISDADTTATGQQVALTVGANTIKVKVTAADTTTTKTYTVVVTRPADATLSALALADTGGTAVTLSPAFASATERYTASVGNAVGEITVSPTTSVNGATVAYLDGNAMPIGDADGTATGHQVALLVGTNTIEVKVTAAGTTTKTYTVLVTRAAGNATGRPSISGTATQGQTLTAGQGGVSDSQGVNQSTIRYAWTRCNDNGNDCNVVMGTGTSYTLTAAEVGLRIRLRLSFTDNAGNAEARESFPWPPRDKNRIAALPATENATLSALALSDGDGAAVALSPAFTETRESYTALVDQAVDEITIALTTGANGATVQYLDADDNAIGDADTTATGQQVALAVGETTIKVMVTATDMAPPRRPTRWWSRAPCRPPKTPR